MDAASALRAPAGGIRLSRRITPLGLIAGLTLLALAFRLTDLGARPLWLDEAFSKWFSGQGWHYLWTVVPTYEAHPPFYYSLLKLWRGMFGDQAVALRALSALLGTLTIPVIMAAAWEQERQSASGRPLLRAGIAAFLVACSPLLIVVGQEARPYPLLAFAYALAILGMLRLMREFAALGPGSLLSWALLGIGTALTLWAHFLGLLYGACLALAFAPAWLKAPLNRVRILRGVAVASAILLAYVPCLIMIASRAHDWGTNWLKWEPGILPFRLLALYSVPVEMLNVGSAVAALAMLLLAKRAVVAAFAVRGWSANRAVILLWLGPPLLAAVISATFIPIFLPRTLAGTLVPAYLAVAAGLAWTPSARERMFLAAAICITLLPTALQTSLRQPAERWNDLAAYLSRNVSAGDQIWLYPSDSALPLDAAEPRIGAQVRALPAPFPTLGVKGPIRAGWPAMVSLTREQAAALATDPALRRVPTVWLVTRQIDIFDPDRDMAKALSRVRNPGNVQEWGYIAAQPFYARPSDR
ncbi:MAG TPA: hypothetical protein VFG41_00255 [Sphingomicrobium sp.]|jgi:uncharacterized membrane protein|nr:hypothetical protein [Sphingomicrobium sp.]